MVEIGFDGHQTLILYQSAKSVSDKVLIRPAAQQMAPVSDQAAAPEFSISGRQINRSAAA
jgi:hypothetical protein